MITWKRIAVPPKDKPLAAWVEASLATLIAVGVPMLVVPEDPWLLDKDFNWAILSPLLITLRYGQLHGFYTLLMLHAGQLATLRLGLVQVDGTFPLQSTLGITITMLLIGEFRNYWIKRNEQLRLGLRYTSERLDSFSRNYLLLKASHDRLEQQLAGQGQSLRTQLQDIRHELASIDLQDPVALARGIFDLLVEHGGFQQAGLYLYAGNTLQTQAAASIGEVSPLIADDPMIAAVKRDQTLATLKDFDLNNESVDTVYQLCLPITDVQGKRYGLVAVSRMQFFALQKSRLNLLNLIAGHIGDLLFTNLGNPVLEQDESALFRSRLQRAQSDAHTYDINAMLLVFRADPLHREGAREVFEFLRNSRRGMDTYLSYRRADTTPHLAVLMPLSKPSDAKGYLQRIESWHQQTYGCALTERGIQEIATLCLPAPRSEINEFLQTNELENATVVTDPRVTA